MKQQVSGLAVAALLTVPCLGVEKSPAQVKVTFSDPVGDVTGAPDEKDPIDVVAVDLFSDGEFVIVETTLSEVPKPAGLMQSLVVGLAFDVDNNRKTGGQASGGAYGDIPGIEFESEMLTSFEDGAASKSAAASVMSVDAKGNQASVLRSSEAPQTPAKGKTFTGKVAYSSLGVASGKTIRVVVRELNDRGESLGRFPDALLLLK